MCVPGIETTQDILLGHWLGEQADQQWKGSSEHVLVTFSSWWFPLESGKTRAGGRRVLLERAEGDDALLRCGNVRFRPPSLTLERDVRKTVWCTRRSYFILLITITEYFGRKGCGLALGRIGGTIHAACSTKKKRTMQNGFFSLEMERNYKEQPQYIHMLISFLKYTTCRKTSTSSYQQFFFFQISSIMVFHSICLISELVLHAYLADISSTCVSFL
jgi:hypothetical protein